MNSLSTVPSQLAAAGVKFAPEIASAAQRYRLDPTLLAAVAAQETGGPGSNAGSNIVGDGGHGHGVFQIDDRWHAFAATPAAMQPQENADYAASMLSGLLKRYGGNVHRALSAYNAGSPNATGTRTTWGDGSTLGYADSVLRHQAMIAGGAQPEPPESLTEACRADHAGTLDSVDRLQSLQMLMNQPAPSTASSGSTSQYSYRSMAGLDGTGHPANGQSSFDGVVFDDDASGDD